MGPAPPFLGNGLLQALFDFQRRRPLGQLQTVGHAEDVGIDSNGRRIEQDTDQDIGRLAADAGQFHQLIESLRHLAMIFFTKDGTVGQDILGLAAIEAAGPYLFFQSRRPQVSIFSGVLYSGNMPAVTILTRSSVHWADKMTAIINQKENYSAEPVS